MTAVTVSDLVEAVRRQQAHQPVVETSLAAAGAVIVSVLGAHPGAGATSVATALADAAAMNPDRRVTLLGLTPDGSQTIRGVADAEVESPVPGLREGRRRGIRVFARAADTRAECPDVTAVLGDVTIIDGPSPYSTRTVVVCRPTLPSAQLTERALHAAGPRAVLAVLGGKRWPRPVEALLGPTIRRTSEEDGIVFIPDNARLRVYGIDTNPTPAPVLAPAAHLLAMLCPDLTDSRADRSKGQTP